jgi:hypothetical protein
MVRQQVRIMPRGRRWLQHVAWLQTAAELTAVRRCVARGAPYGDQAWQRRAVSRLGLQSTRRARGRPRKAKP